MGHPYHGGNPVSAPPRFHLVIEMDNAAFSDPEPGAPSEVSRILDLVAQRLARRGRFYTGEGGSLVDINGNTVGAWHVTDIIEESNT